MRREIENCLRVRRDKKNSWNFEPRKRDLISLSVTYLEYANTTLAFRWLWFAERVALSSTGFTIGDARRNFLR